MLAQMLLFVLFASCLALKCDQQWECSSVTRDYNFVKCKNDKCVCRESQGFSGDATTGSKCNCKGSVYWRNNDAYCLTVAQVQSCSALSTVSSSYWTKECSEQWQCQDFSQNYQFMDCQKGKCVCSRDQGFIGKATRGDLCRCQEDTIWIGSTAYCLDIKDCAENS